FRIINRSLYEEIYVFRCYDLIVKPISLLYYHLVYDKQAFISDTYQRIIQSILYKLFDGSFRQEIQVARFVNPVDYDFLRSIRFATRVYNGSLHLVVEPFRLFIAENINQFYSE